ncbi:MAG: DUF4160 domain-containing protein [Hyphomonadaceae bacterium]|nr:DUF4160 domain-containing protein [Hyphomonadaceae bacterium]
MHIDKAGCSAKVWLADLSLATNHGFRQHELRRVIEMVRDHQSEFEKAWHDYFGTRP